MKYLVYVIVFPYYVMYKVIKWAVCRNRQSTLPAPVYVPSIDDIRKQDELEALDHLVAVQQKKLNKMVECHIDDEKIAKLQLQIIRNNNKALKLREELEDYV